MPASEAVITPARRAPVSTAAPIRPAPTMASLQFGFSLTPVRIPQWLADARRDLCRGRFGQVARHGDPLQALHHSVLVAADEEGATEALGPDAGVQAAGLVDQREAALLEEADRVRPGEQDGHA